MSKNYQDNLNRLRELHAIVKRNPYRENGDLKYLSGYRDTLYNLSHVFYLVITETEYKEAKNMIHDFNGSISNIEYKKDKNYWYHVEQCIGTIHEFLDTGRVDSFWTYYTGGNIPRGLPRMVKHQYKDGKYYPVFKQSEVDEAVEFIKDKLEKHPQYTSWYEPELEWIKSAIINGE